MTETDSLANILAIIAATEPKPWYPGEYVRANLMSRDDVDEPLNRLRVAGLVRMTDWEAGKGQGYYLTIEGQRALRDPKKLREPEVESSPRPSRKSWFADSEDSTITRLLIAAQIGMFGVGLIQSLELGLPVGQYLDGRAAAGTVSTYLAVSGRAILGGAWWTLLSYALVHGGLLHLGFNLFGHFYDAAQLERLIGHMRFAAVYVISVLFGGIGAVLASPPMSRTVGSSGGLCGVIAAQFVWLLFQRHLFRQAHWNSLIRNYTRVAVMIVIISMIPGVSWGGHFGGAIGGALTFLLMHLTGNSNVWVRRLGWLGTALLPLIAVGGQWWWLHRGVGP